MTAIKSLKPLKKGIMVFNPSLKLAVHVQKNTKTDC